MADTTRWYLELGRESPVQVRTPFLAELEKISKARWAREFAHLSNDAKRRITDYFTKTPGSIKSPKHLWRIGAGGENEVDLVMHPRHGTVVRKVPRIISLDPSEQAKADYYNDDGIRLWRRAAELDKPRSGGFAHLLEYEPGPGRPRAYFEYAGNDVMSRPIRARANQLEKRRKLVTSIEEREKQRLNDALRTGSLSEEAHRSAQDALTHRARNLRKGIIKEERKNSERFSENVTYRLPPKAQEVIGKLEGERGIEAEIRRTENALDIRPPNIVGGRVVDMSDRTLVPQVPADKRLPRRSELLRSLESKTKAERLARRRELTQELATYKALGPGSREPKKARGAVANQAPLSRVDRFYLHGKAMKAMRADRSEQRSDVLRMGGRDQINEELRRRGIRAAAPLPPPPQRPAIESGARPVSGNNAGPRSNTTEEGRWNMPRRVPNAAGVGLTGVGGAAAAAAAALAARRRQKEKKAEEIQYRGHRFPGYNQPIPSNKKDKKMMVLVKSGDRVKLIHFGQRGYKHNYSDAAKRNYLARSAGIRGKDGRVTAQDPMSANYWARRVLWPEGPADGSAKTASEKKTTFFHGSPHKFDTLRGGSWVTPYREDAIRFGVPWSSSELRDAGSADGRPPKKLDFKGSPPEDAPLYLYAVQAPTKAADTNTGHSYDWNRQILKDTPVKLVAAYPSWQKLLLKRPRPGKEKSADVRGHWRQLEPGEQGHDQARNPIEGRTWVQSRLKVDVKPKKHQTGFTQAALTTPGVIAAHGTGTGKTLSAIMAFEEGKASGKATRALVVTPAGLRENFKSKGVDRFTDSKAVILEKPEKLSPDIDYAIVSYDAFRRRPQEWIDAVKPDTLIADELHRAGNPDSRNWQSLQYARERVPRFMGLTASVVQNQPSDVIPLLRLANPEYPIRERREFNRKFLRSEESKSKGIFGGKKRDAKIVNVNELRRAIGPSIHYVEDLDATEKPAKVVKTVEVPMSPEQVRLYRLSMKGIDPKIVAKIQAGESVSQKDAMHVFMRLLRARQVSNSISSIDEKLSPEEAAVRTPKTKRILDEAVDHLRKTPDGQVVMFSNFYKGTIDVLAAGLRKAGIPYGIFAGQGQPDMSEESRQRAVEDYLAGKNRVLLITGAGAEGLSLGNTTMVQMVDGHFNPERIAQAEARGIRAGGLAHRKPEDRRVDVRRYVSSLPKGFWKTITFQPKEHSVDEWVYATADRKDRLNKQLRRALDQTSDYHERQREAPFWKRPFMRGP